MPKNWWTPWNSINRIPALTAAAEIVSPPTPDQVAAGERSPGRRVYRSPEEWQREVWDFHDTLGEFAQGVKWKGNLLSRVRLIAARRPDPDEEPEPIKSGPAADFMKELSGGLGGQAALMANFATYLSVPGECWLVGETNAAGRNDWYTRSIEEVGPSQSDPRAYKISEGNGKWRDLSSESLVVRVWRPHPRWHNVATAPARACRPILRELELINRHIQTQFLSRLASAGVIIFPDEITFPVREEFADAPDPFVSEWIEIAAEAIATPGTASAIVPIPIRVPGEYVDKIKHIDFTLKLDEQIIDKRSSALARLAISMDMPPEALLGTRDVNHWAAYLIDEQGVKIHVAPDVEVVCDSLTRGYLWPRLQAAGVPIDDIMVWYDPSALVLRPDKSKAATDAYDRGELSPRSYRSNVGFDETDAPSGDELKRVVLLKMALTQPVNSMGAMGQMFPEMQAMLPADKPADAERPPPEGAPPPAEIPPERDRTSPPAQKAAGGLGVVGLTEEVLTQLTAQAGLEHAIRVGFGAEWTLLHPRDCIDHLWSCPVTHSTWHPTVAAMPGAPGVYACWLNRAGQPVVGERMMDGDARDMLPSTHVAVDGTRELV